MIAQITLEDVERHETLRKSDIGKWALWLNGAIAAMSESKEALSRVTEVLEDMQPDYDME